MKKVLLFLAISSLLLNSCDYLRKKGILANKEYVERLENTIKDDSLEMEVLLERAKAESDRKIDSILQTCAAPKGNFWVITGSFKVASNADNYIKTMSRLGYKPEVISGPNGFQLVSAYQGTDYKESLQVLANIRNNVNPESWLYIKP